ncbi:hypothetical protein LUZ60_010212 [Juncus effusus]|nr:hypothetical protein LUZ60_010212 [Juncus effusus]
MLFQAKIQPMDPKSTFRIDPARHRPSLLRRFFVPRAIAAPSPATSAAKAEADKDSDDSGGGVDPSSVCLDRMVLNFMEETTEISKPLKSRCNCFNGNYDESSDEEIDLQYCDVTTTTQTSSSPMDALELIKGLIPCVSLTERNLLADVSKLTERTKNSKCGKSEYRKIVAEGLKSLGYDAAVCKSRWEKTNSIPAGEHEYIEVISSGARLLVEIDFRSEFEIARSTKSYRSVLQSLPSIFVGSADRMAKIVTLVSESAKQSMKKKGLHFPPWRKSEYLRAKWMSPVKREMESEEELSTGGEVLAGNFKGEFEMRFEQEMTTVFVSAVRRPEEETAKRKVIPGLSSVL